MKKKVKQEPLTAQQLADMVGCTRRNIYSSRDRGLLECNEQGLFDITVDVNAAFIEERKNGKVKPGRPVTLSDEKGVETGSLKEANLKKKQADAELAQIRVDYANKVLLPTDFITDQLMKYIERLHSNIERLAGTSIQDFSKEILAEGQLTSKMINDFINLYLSTIHGTVQQMLKEIEKFEPQKHKVRI